MNHRRFLAMLLLPFVLLLAGCAGDDDGGSINSQIITNAGGTFRFQNDRLTLVVPANSINQTSTVAVNQTSTYPANTRVLAATAFQVTSTPANATFSAAAPATIRIHYPVLLGANPTLYTIHRVEGGLWAEIPNSMVNLAGGYVEAQVQGLGTYAVLAGPPGVTFRTVLGTSQEVNPVVAPDNNASGAATVFIPNDNSSITVRIQSQGLTNVTMAHIHVGILGANGPVAVTLFNSTLPGTYPAWSNDYIFTATAANLNLGTVASIEDVAEAIHANHAYVNVHTQANGGGAIRGQLGESILLVANLDGAQEVPAVATAASGNATIRLNRDMSQIHVDLHTMGLTDVRMAHLHGNVMGENGPIVFPLFTGGTWTDPLEVTLTSANLAASAGMTFDQAINALLSEGMYVNVHTGAHLSGEIRGQVMPPAIP